MWVKAATLLTPRRSSAQGLPELQADCSGSSISQSYSHTSDGILDHNSSTSGIEGVSETLWICSTYWFQNTSGYTSVLEMKIAVGDNIGHYRLYIICRLLLGDHGSRRAEKSFPFFLSWPVVKQILCNGIVDPLPPLSYSNFHPPSLYFIKFQSLFGNSEQT